MKIYVTHKIYCCCNEVAFLCMDLDAFGRQDLSALFIEYYNNFFPAMKTREYRSLFIYKKLPGQYTCKSQQPPGKECRR